MFINSPPPAVCVCWRQPDLCWQLLVNISYLTSGINVENLQQGRGGDASSAGRDTAPADGMHWAASEPLSIAKWQDMVFSEALNDFNCVNEQDLFSVLSDDGALRKENEPKSQDVFKRIMLTVKWSADMCQVLGDRFYILDIMLNNAKLSWPLNLKSQLELSIVDEPRYDIYHDIHVDHDMCCWWIMTMSCTEITTTVLFYY